jgi:glycosyltransferase involved in cell wall biosynthesis
MDTRPHRGGSRRSDTAVVIPAFNEERSLPALLRAVQESVPEADIVVVNDGSTDRTAEVARASGAILLDLACNMGVGTAVQAGFRYARDHGYEWAVRLDADGQHPPEAIPALLEHSRHTGADLTLGSRFLTDGGYRSTRFRCLGIRCLAFFLSVICRRWVTDPTSGFQVLNRPLLHFFAEVYPVDYPEPEALAILRRHGYDFAEVPVAFRERASGRSSIRGWGTFYYMTKVFVALAIDRMKPKIARFDRERMMAYLYGRTVV